MKIPERNYCSKLEIRNSAVCFSFLFKACRIVEFCLENSRQSGLDLHRHGTFDTEKMKLISEATRSLSDFRCLLQSNKGEDRIKKTFAKFSLQSPSNCGYLERKAPGTALLRHMVIPGLPLMRMIFLNALIVLKTLAAKLYVQNN